MQKRITFRKGMLKLREDVERNYAADTSAATSSPSQIVQNTKSKHSDADSVTIPSSEMDNNSSTSTATVEVNNDSASLQNAQKIARDMKAHGQDANFKVRLNNSFERKGRVVENVTFSKKELIEFLRSI